MKRWFTAALALAMLVSPMKPIYLSADAEGVEEVVTAPVEEAVPEVEIAELEGLMLVDEAAEDIEAPEEAEISEPKEAELTFYIGSERYGRTTAEALVCASPDAATAFARVSAGGTLLLLGQSSGWREIAFSSERGIVTGYVSEDCIDVLDDDAANAFIEAASGSALYDGDPARPLDMPGCAFIEAQSKDQAAANAGSFTVTGSLDALVVGGSCALSVLNDAGRPVSRDDLFFFSTNDNIVSVSDRGVVTAHSAGSADIVVSYDGAIQSIPMTVPQEPDAIALEAKAIALKETASAPAVVMMPAGTAASVKWSSDNSKVVVIDADTGAMLGKKKGTANITATTRNGRTATCAVTVGKAPSKVTLTLSAEVLGVGETAQAIPAVNSAAVCSSFTFQSSNAAVARVDEATGLITGVSSGSATITVRTFNKKTASATIRVCGEPARLAFPADSVSVGIGRTVSLTPMVYDASGSVTSAALTYSLISFVSGSCVSLNAATGEVTGLCEGIAVVSATARNGVSADCIVSVVPAPKAVRLSESALSLGVKDSYEGLTVVLTMSDGSQSIDTTARWSVDRPKYVSVDESTGKLTALKKGTAVVTATTSWGMSASCTVTVLKAPGKITLSPSTLTLAEGMTEALTVTLPKNTASSIRYSSSKPSVATVDADGVVTAVGEGRATITAATCNGKTAACSVTVSGRPVRIRFTDTAKTLSCGQTVALTAEITTQSGQTVTGGATYYIDPASPNPGCIRLNESTGEITALSEGYALVGARTGNGLQTDALCLVTVQAAPVALICPSTTTIGVGQTATLSVQVRYSNGQVADATDLIWSSSKTKYVTVDSHTGEMTGVKKGTAVITATTYNGVSASCQVTVSGTAPKLTLSPSTLKLSAGGMRFALQASGSSDITFTSGNVSVAVVSADGVITTMGRGSTIITASTASGLTAQCALTVTDMPASASFATTAATLKVNEYTTPEVYVRTQDGSEAAADLHFSVLSGAQYISLDSATGRITGLSTGVAVVSVETHNGVVASNTFTVTVKSKSSGDVEVVPQDNLELALGVGEYSTELAGAVSYGTWTSTKPDVATVDNRGNVTAVGTGTTTVTAVVNDVTVLRCSVKVSKAPTSVSISPENGRLTVGATGQYKVTLSSRAGGSYTFSSSNPKVATIDSDGKVTAIKAGTTTITATTYNGLSASTTLTVVKQDASDPSIPSEMVKLGVASYQSTYDSSMSNEMKLEYVIYVGQGQLGMPYIYGGGYNDSHPDGFDCSGFVYWCFKHIGIKLGSSAKSQGYDSRFSKISEIKDLKRGDVVCFNTSDDDDLSDHTGIYLGNGYFIHASSGKSKMKVVVQKFKGDSISGDYYTRNFSWGRRILE